eukprot:403360496
MYNGYNQQDLSSDDSTVLDQYQKNSSIVIKSKGSVIKQESLVNSQTKSDCMFKVVLLGDSQVGKTSIVHRLVDSSFILEHQPTLGFDFSFKKMRIGEKVISLQIRGAQGFVCIFDQSKKSSCENIAKWVQQIRVNASIENPTIMVLGNKRDLDQTLRQAVFKEIEEFQANPNHRDVIYAEVSARTGFMINESFRTLGQKMMEKGHQIEVSGFKIQANNNNTSHNHSKHDIYGRCQSNSSNNMRVMLHGTPGKSSISKRLSKNQLMPANAHGMCCQGAGSRSNRNKCCTV